MQGIRPEETRLVGQWRMSDGSVVGDETCAHINQLIAGWLQEVAVSDGGWAKLYKDPQDGRYWELTYPHSDWHGGGPPMLMCMSNDEVEGRYGDINQ